jgi:hypothetical protein
VSSKKLRVIIAAWTNEEQKAPITAESGRGFQLFSAQIEIQDARLLLKCWHLMEVNISLREGYGHTLGIKTLFNAAGYIPVYVPIMLSCDPRPDNKINRGIA